MSAALEQRVGKLFAPASLEQRQRRRRLRRSHFRPDWHYALLAELIEAGASYTSLEQLGGSRHTWSTRITEAQTRGLLSRGRITEYGRIAARSAP